MLLLTQCDGSIVSVRNSTFLLKSDSLHANRFFFVSNIHKKKKFDKIEQLEMEPHSTVNYSNENENNSKVNSMTKKTLTYKLC